MTKNQISKIVKEQYRSKAFDGLLELQLKLSKGDNLVYGELKMRGYLKYQKLNPNHAKLIFMFRSRMINVKENYKVGLENLICPCCNLLPDSQLHLISCSKSSSVVTDLEYESIFESNEETMLEVIKKLEIKLKDRRDILENQL